MEKVTFTRKGLYDIVWTQSLQALAKKYNISDNGLRKICKRMDIPLPPNGHWQKVQYHRPVKRIELSTDYTGKNEVTLDEMGINDEKPDSPVTIQRRLTKELENNSKLPLKVPERLNNPDQLIIRTKEYYDAVKRYDWRHDGSYPDRNSKVNISVSQDNIPRALRLMDTFIKLLQFRNHDVVTKYDKTITIIEGEEIEFRLRDRKRVSEVKDHWGDKQLETTNEFVFIIGPNYQMKEIKDGKDLLESKLAQILAKMESIGKQKKEERIRWEIKRKELEEKERIASEIKERKEKELSDFTNLLKQANRWKQMLILREYIDEVESIAIRKKSLTEDLNGWITWAREKTAWYDPLTNREDPFLSEIDKQISLN